MGDGVGPEIMKSTLAILDAAGANLKMETIEIGEKIYKSGHSSGIAPASWDSLRRTKVFLKAPITTPSGGGFKSLNVSIRKTLGLYANVRPCISYHPFVATKHPKVDMVIVRENEEDLYAGIEHRQTNQVYQCLKIISRPGCERIVRYAFEYARMHGRKRVTCVVKDNIMKLTDGLFYDVFESIGKAEYPEIVRERMIVDIAAAMIADKPERFDVVVTLNLYGDIISDVAAQITGSVGLGGSANIGEHIAMFEAIHGSAPDIAGKDMANPTGLLLGAVQMLMHVKHAETATNVYNAWLRTIEDGVHTGDIYNKSTSSKLVGTKDFTKAVIERLGSKPRVMSAAQFMDTPTREVARELNTKRWVAAPQKKILTGVDVFLDWDGQDADELAARLNAALATSPLASKNLKLALITNRGVKVWPGGFPETFRVDHWRCRFRATASPMAMVDYSVVLEIMRAAHSAGLDVIKSENLCVYENVDGSQSLGFSLGQGE
jgi:isocitrate dehydrogenase